MEDTQVNKLFSRAMSLDDLLKDLGIEEGSLDEEIKIKEEPILFRDPLAATSRGSPRIRPPTAQRQPRPAAASSSDLSEGISTRSGKPGN